MSRKNMAYNYTALEYCYAKSMERIQDGKPVPACSNMSIEIMHKNRGNVETKQEQQETIVSQGKKEPNTSRTEQHTASVGSKLDFV